ncbi:MAG: DNA primase, partial [Flavitalea sp.]
YGPVDNYRGRIIFPIHNQSGKVLGFGARIIAKNDRAPKYINTPENEIYVKSRILYGSYFARQAIDKQDECLLVEGYTDVVSLHQAGIENVVASGGTSLTPDQLRLIKKYTKNLTIIYDGDSAGVKAALRGLDLALEEGLNVQLVLIPDNEDPDSYVNKIGAAAFQDFINTSKKDFIFFQLEILMKDAGKDMAKRSAIVNQVAETISKINKVEDFTKQQDYIRQCSQMMNIEEAGLLQLVHKFSKEKTEKFIARENAENRQKQLSQASGNPQADSQPLPPEYGETDNTSLLLARDEINEKALVRCLIEFGMKEWDEQSTVADYILHQLDEEQLLEQDQLQKLVEMYGIWYREGIEPGPKNFLYHEDQELGRYVVGLLDFPYELSPNWKDHFEGKIFTREDLYKEDVISTLHYLKLRKIKKMIDENQRDLQNADNNDDMMILVQTHQHLKTVERDLLKLLGTVVVR